MKPSFSATCSGVGRVVVALLLAAATTALAPQHGEAQCVGCSWAANCTPATYGANDCTQGSFFVSDDGSDDGVNGNGYWVDWCFTFGGQCEWLVHLDFADDGTAYVPGGRAGSGHEQTLLEHEEAEMSLQTCDGVLLAVHRADDRDVVRDDPITLRL